MTPAEKTAHAAKMEAVNLARKAEKEQKHAECRAWCAKKWDRSEDATNENPYLKSRGVNAYEVKCYKDTLLVPVRDIEGAIHGLQFIAPDSSKRFKIGTDKIGHFHSIGKAEDNTLLIAEGYATAASIHQATGHPVVVAFDKGNLKPVAEIIKAKCPHLKIIICADNDQWTPGNPGLTAATEAARAVNGLLVVPVFEGVRHE
jgi:putative DNA primase/helicase